MKLTLTIESGNEALVEDGREYQIEQLLQETAQKVVGGHTSGYLRDYNGNHVGYWELEG